MLVSILICAAVNAQTGGPPVLPPAWQGLAELVETPDHFVDTLRAMDKRSKKRAFMLLEQARALDSQQQQGQIDALTSRASMLMGDVRAAYVYGLYHLSEDARLHNYYGELLSDWYRDEKLALLEWQKAISLDPKLSAAHANLGMYYCARGNLAMGLQHLDEAIDLDSKEASFYYNLSQVYLLRREKAAAQRGWDSAKLYKRAMQASKTAAELAPHDFEYLQDYAVNFFAAKDFKLEPAWDEAARAWQQARACAPSMANVFFAWLNEARALLWAGQRSKAEQCLMQALRIRPGYADATAMLEGIRAGVEF